MIKRGGLPGRGSVTIGAKLTHTALMRVIIGMTGIAVAGCALEDTIDMAARTGGGSMRARQLEN